jgi:uncharacterized protein (UPF0548 family)
VDVHLRRPSDDDLARLLARCKGDVLTYAPAGCTLDGTAPVSLTRREWSTTFGSGHDFALAVDALSHWKVQEHAGLVVRSDGPMAVGTNVAMSAGLPIGFIDVTCRVVAVVDEPDRFGFAYGTLSVHPERGEEAFIVSRSAEGFRFDVTAVSRPASRLVRIASPVAHRLQAAATDRYLGAMNLLTQCSRDD